LESNNEVSYDILRKIDSFIIVKDSDRRIKFQRFLLIIEYYDCAQINKYGYGNAAVKNGFTETFKEHGGFKTIYQDEWNRIEKEVQKEQLNIENLRLQNDNLEFLKTIRDQEAKIRNLEEQTKFMELLKSYWWVLLTCMGIGIFATKVWNIIMK